MTTTRTVLITGCSGQVGFELARSLQGLGRVLTPLREELDLSSPESVRAYVRRQRPDLIVNPAAYTAVDKAEDHRAAAWAVNAEAPALLAEEAKRLGAAIVHYSTDYVFDGTKSGSYVEDDETCPANVYGASKLAGEQALRDAGVPHFVFRTSWVYGGRGANFLLTMLKLAHDKNELDIVADQVGAPTWSRTISDLTGQVLAQGIAQGDLSNWIGERSGIYHLTSAGSASWADFAEAIFDDANLAKHPTVRRIPTSEFPRPAKRPLNSRMSCEKIAQTFGVQPPEWRDALRLCLEEIQVCNG